MRAMSLSNDPEIKEAIKKANADHPMLYGQELYFLLTLDCDRKHILKEGALVERGRWKQALELRLDDGRDELETWNEKGFQQEQIEIEKESLSDEELDTLEAEAIEELAREKKITREKAAAEEDEIGRRVDRMIADELELETPRVLHPGAEVFCYGRREIVPTVCFCHLTGNGGGDRLAVKNDHWDPQPIVYFNVGNRTVWVDEKEVPPGASLVETIEAPARRERLRVQEQADAELMRTSGHTTVTYE